MKSHKDATCLFIYICCPEDVEADDEGPCSHAPWRPGKSASWMFLCMYSAFCKAMFKYVFFIHKYRVSRIDGIPWVGH